LQEFRNRSPGENPRLAWLKAQILHAVRSEMAMRLEDALRRRTSMMLFSHDNGMTYVEELGAEMGRLLGWQPTRLAEEIAYYRRSVDGMFAWRQGISAPDTRARSEAPSTGLDEGWG
jgi:glycerol-3-phosphate dehydrogenase